MVTKVDQICDEEIVMKNLLGLMVLMLSGCSTMAPAGRDSFMVHTSSGPRAANMASKKCSESGQVIVIRNLSTDINGATMVFSCVDENDPENQRPNLRKDNGVNTVENR